MTPRPTPSSSPPSSSPPSATRRAEVSRRRLLALGAGAATAGIAWNAIGSAPSAAAQPPPANYDVHFFYYPWYGTPEVSGGWRHWQQGGFEPPEAIGADFYPALGPYDAGDPAVVDQHMAWVRRAGVGVVATTWWGQGGFEDRQVPVLLDAAAAHGVRVAWHLEPYGGRTAASTVADIRYIDATYGAHPAFHRDAGHGDRPVFYVFNSLSIADWSPLSAVAQDAIVLTQTTDISKATHFGGLYNYTNFGDMTGWQGIADWCRANGRIWAPSISPSYLDDRAVPGNTTPELPHNDGETYDQQWSGALAPENGGLPDWVSITSFNEWHEGSMVEPVSSAPPAGHGYKTFEGAYGTTGAASETAYLDRTALWAARFAAARAEGRR
ncbi:glycoside hydrolase family 99 protein [Streptomyces radicis]|uniref:Alpha-mannosidase n=1 Tax=Streptomyces radicis TaxID=1750517 RepID=A0A3A9VYW6_9ACTN|nr:glycoside hydrolase family 99 protein [Streptomyces radicis]RKN05712.1 alpha-mannosidase [Streptomyces radicis]RKN17552.1 alpha-mannosidase [Streptomyces radicis]